MTHSSLHLFTCAELLCTAAGQWTVQVVAKFLLQVHVDRLAHAVVGLTHALVYASSSRVHCSCE
jgi:hypothetical protein